MTQTSANVTERPDEQRPRVLVSLSGEYPLHEFHFAAAGREWIVLHSGLILTAAEEQQFLRQHRDEIPYGVALWPSAIALAQELATRGRDLAGKRVLELGAGTGLPGIVAASLGADVVQTDRQEAALSLCRINGRENGVDDIEHREVDWREWRSGESYDWIIGSDILYNEPTHRHLKRIFDVSLALGGRVLLSDPLRMMSLWLLEEMQSDGWSVRFTQWRLGEADEPRMIGVFEMTR
jgi:methyltransferase-like protein 23